MDVASLRIAIQTGDIKTAEKELEKLERQSKDTEKATDKLSLAWGAAGTAIVASVFAIGRASVQAAQEAEQANSKMLAVLRATGFAAGLTADQLDDMADAMAASTRFDDESIRNASSVLLTFRNVQGDTFREGIKLASDLASVMGSDLNSAALQVGKALNDPVQGVSALSRVGIQFSEVQKDQIKAFVETNQLAKAQEIILGELRAQVGGTAEAMNTGLTKATNDLSKAFGELFESLGRSREVQGTVTTFSEVSTAALQSLTEEINKTGGALSGFTNFVFKPFDFNLLGFDDGTKAAQEFNSELERMQKRIATLGAERQRAQQDADVKAAADKKAAEDQAKADAALAKERKRQNEKEREERIKIGREIALAEGEAISKRNEEFQKTQEEQNKQVLEGIVAAAERQIEEDFQIAEQRAKAQIEANKKQEEMQKKLRDDLYNDTKNALMRAFEEGKNPAAAFAKALGSTIFSRVTADLAAALATSALKGLGFGSTTGTTSQGPNTTDMIFGAIGKWWSGLSFDGGGDTWSGPRAGGMDGKGGMLAMLHPNERVIDNTKGGGASVVYSPVINIDSRTDRGEVMRLVQSAVQTGNSQLVDRLQRQGRL